MIARSGKMIILNCRFVGRGNNSKGFKSNCFTDKALLTLAVKERKREREREREKDLKMQ